MTIVIERYKNNDNELIQANIEQNKYELSYILTVTELYDINSPIAETIYNNRFNSIAYARKALKRLEKYTGKFIRVKEI